MYFLLCLFFLSPSLASLVTDVTDELFSVSSHDIIGAFGDFNANKLTDIFVICKEGKEINVLLADEKSKKYTRQHLMNTTEYGPGAYFVGITPGDFDGDLQMDILILVKTGNGLIQAGIYWSDHTTTAISEDLIDQPLIMDWNADRLPDVLGETKSGMFVVWIASNNRNFTRTEVPQKESPSKFKKPNSNAFIDLNNDYITDLYLTKEENYEEWYNIEGTLTWNRTVPFPHGYNYIGQTSFADLNQDSLQDIVWPVCKSSDQNQCSGSQIVMYNKNEDKTYVILDSFKNEDITWEFVQNGGTAGVLLTNKQTFPATLRMGDFNMDGYPDALAILQSEQGGKTVQNAFLLLNEECKSGYCADIGRKLVVQWDSEFSKIYGAVLATFFDLYDDGVLDVLLVSISDNNKPLLMAYKNIFSDDTCFLKVTVVSGVCNKNCPPGTEPYGGSNVPGVSINYETLTTKGDPQKSCATQLSQSAHFALQLPYTIFGLGQTPNFVDKLGIGMAQNTTHLDVRIWTQIIPNSQLVVIPYPYDSPSSWVLHLFATPSRTIYITGAVLIGTCGFVAGIVGILHLRDRREDRLEKQQESQKFHFDAM